RQGCWLQKERLVAQSRRAAAWPRMQRWSSSLQGNRWGAASRDGGLPYFADVENTAT
ncbi:hypothetical protein HaLaN_26801, partial [Haematococcus lacustris]